MHNFLRCWTCSCSLFKTLNYICVWITLAWILWPRNSHHLHITMSYHGNIHCATLGRESWLKQELDGHHKLERFCSHFMHFIAWTLLISRGLLGKNMSLIQKTGNMNIIQLWNRYINDTCRLVAMFGKTYYNILHSILWKSIFKLLKINSM